MYTPSLVPKPLYEEALHNTCVSYNIKGACVIASDLTQSLHVRERTLTHI